MPDDDGLVPELHDGVLQTLALIERRADQHDLAQLAREQERALRAFLAGDRDAGPTTLGAALRRSARTASWRKKPNRDIAYRSPPRSSRSSIPISELTRAANSVVVSSWT